MNNAGVMNFKPLGEISDEEWRAVLDVDLLGAVRFPPRGLPRDAAWRRDRQRRQRHAFETMSLVAPYAAAKAALLSLTRLAAIEGKPKGLRANAVVPGAVDTAMLHNNPNLRRGA